MVEQAIEVSTPVAEPLGEEEEEEEEGEGIEENNRRGSSSTGSLVPQRATMPQWTMPMGPGFWLSGQSAWVARWGRPTSSKAWGKAPILVLSPPEMDKELEGGSSRRRLWRRRCSWGGMLPT